MFKRIIFTLIIVVILAIGYLLATKSDTVDAESHASEITDITLPKKSENYKIGVYPGLKNYVVKYRDNIYRGGSILTVEGVEMLKKWQIETVVSITPTEQERALLKEYKLQLVEIVFPYENLTFTNIDQFIEAVAANKKVYIHCHGGTHRAGILAMVDRIVNCQWSYEKAETEFIDLGGYPLKDRAMLEVVKKYTEQRVNSNETKRSTTPAK